jgi:hypothetical protein
MVGFPVIPKLKKGGNFICLMNMFTGHSKSSVNQKPGGKAFNISSPSIDIISLL